MNSYNKLTIQLQDKKNTFKQAFKDNGEKIIISYEKMYQKDSNGNPDYRDPKKNPVLWDETV